MSKSDSEDDEYSYTEDDDGDEELSNSGKDAVALCDHDVIALDGPLGEEHTANQKLRASIRKSPSTLLSASSLYHSVKGRFVVLNSKDEWVETDEDTAIAFLEGLVRKLRIRRATSSDDSFSLVDKPGDSDTLASASVIGRDEAPLEVEGWDMISGGQGERIELDLSSVLSQLNQMDVSPTTQDSQASASLVPTSTSTYTMPASSVAPSRSGQQGGDACSVSTAFSFVLADGKQACRRCTFLNEPSATVCVVCDFALGATNPTLDLDAEIAVRLAKEEQDRASCMALGVIQEEVMEIEDNPLERCRTYAEKVSKSVASVAKQRLLLHVAAVPDKDLLYLCDSFINTSDHFWFLNQQSPGLNFPWDTKEVFCVVQTDEDFRSVCKNGFGDGTVVALGSFGLSQQKGKNTWICVVLLGKRGVDFFPVDDGSDGASGWAKLKDGKQCLPLAHFETARDAGFFWDLLQSAPASMFMTPSRSLRRTTPSTTSPSPVAPDVKFASLFLDEFLHRLRVLNECVCRVVQTDQKVIPRIFSSSEHASDWLDCRRKFESRCQESPSCNANPYVGFFATPLGVRPNDIVSNKGLGNNVTISPTCYWAAAQDHDRPYWVALVLLGDLRKDYHTFEMHTGERKETFFNISEWRQVLPIAVVPKIYTYNLRRRLIESLIRETVLAPLSGVRPSLVYNDVISRAQDRIAPRGEKRKHVAG